MLNNTQRRCAREPFDFIIFLLNDIVKFNPYYEDAKKCSLYHSIEHTAYFRYSLYYIATVKFTENLILSTINSKLIKPTKMTVPLEFYYH